MDPTGTDTDNSRPTITGLKAHALLTEDFTRSRPASCRRCKVPATFWGPAPNNDVYWFLQMPDACRHGCHKLLVELWAKITTENKIAPPQRPPIFAMASRRNAASQE